MDHVLLILHFLALAIGIGGGVASGVLAEISDRSEPTGKLAIGKAASIIGDVGLVSVLVLWLTGIWMVLEIFGGFSDMPAGFNLKILGVVALSAALLAMQVVKRKAKAAGQAPDPARMKVLGQIAMLSAVFTVSVAVITFA